MKPYVWPPRTIPCPDCKQEMRFYATGLGQRYYYQCSTPARADRKPRQYARWPALWCRHPEAFHAQMDIRGHIDVMFLIEDGGTLLPIVAHCSKCNGIISGLFSREATAGFVHETSEDEGWQNHHNDPTFTTSIVCDQCQLALA